MDGTGGQHHCTWDVIAKARCVSWKWTNNILPTLCVIRKHTIGNVLPCVITDHPSGPTLSMSQSHFIIEGSQPLPTAVCHAPSHGVLRSLCQCFSKPVILLLLLCIKRTTKVFYQLSWSVKCIYRAIRWLQAGVYISSLFLMERDQTWPHGLLYTRCHYFILRNVHSDVQKSVLYRQSIRHVCDVILAVQKRGDLQEHISCTVK